MNHLTQFPRQTLTLGQGMTQFPWQTLSLGRGQRYGNYGIGNLGVTTQFPRQTLTLGQVPPANLEMWGTIVGAGLGALAVASLPRRDRARWWALPALSAVAGSAVGRFAEARA